jgi:hypothetical protein
LAVCGKLLSWRWLQYLAGVLLVATGAALLIFAVHPVDILRPFADSITADGMGRPFIPASTNRYVAGAIVRSLCGSIIFLSLNHTRKDSG